MEGSGSKIMSARGVNSRIGANIHSDQKEPINSCTVGCGDFGVFFKIQFVHAVLNRKWGPNATRLNMFLLISNLCIVDFVFS
jgi:hypothetical protein